MKKAFCIKKNLRFVLISLLTGCFFVLTSCGLDEYINLEPPVVDHYQSYSNSDPAEMYFRVKGDNSNNSDGAFTYEGVKIFYKIFYTTSRLESSISNLSPRTNSSVENYYDDGTYDRMIGEGYKELSSALRSSKNDGYDVIEFRLTTYGDESPYIKLNDSSYGKPRRYSAGANVLDFDFQYSENNIPQKGDEDCETDIPSDTVEFYVNLYAVSTGYDTVFAQKSSQIVHLGSQKITVR